MIAALFVYPGGVYYGLDNVEAWGPEKDARLYAGPYPVIAHPPCARWGKYWSGGPSVRVKRKLGDDENCFATAFHCVKLWGGVLEHPAYTKAWNWFGIRSPEKSCWVLDSIHGGWVCHVEQGHYGHLARKATWLFANTKEKPLELIWGPSSASVKLDAGYHSAEERRNAKDKKTRDTERLSAYQRAATPIEFRDLLITIAKGCNA